VSQFPARQTPQFIVDQWQQLVRGGWITPVDPDQNAGDSFIGSLGKTLGSVHHHNSTISRTQTSFCSTPISGSEKRL
jgi:hypothetical protein